MRYLILLTLVGCVGERNCSEVVSIGQCYSNGSCEVRLKDGQTVIAYLPKQGRQACEL